MSVLFKNVLRKIAAGDDDAKTKPNPIAMVGNYPYDAKYYPGGGPKLPSFLQPLGGRGNKYFDALYDPSLIIGNATNIDLPHKQYDNYDMFVGQPIRRQDLDMIRSRQAGGNADFFGPNTPQRESAYQYLLQRGAENEALFKSGDLYQGGTRPKSKVPLPNNIKNPAYRKRLEQFGNVQVNNNIPGGGRGQGFGIG